MDDKIYLITVKETDERGITETIVSHGVGNDSLKNYVMPNLPLFYFKYFQDDGGIYVEGGTNE